MKAPSGFNQTLMGENYTRVLSTLKPGFFFSDELALLQQGPTVRRCRLTHQVDPGLKALYCQPVESTSLSKLWFQICQPAPLHRGRRPGVWQRWHGCAAQSAPAICDTRVTRTLQSDCSLIRIVCPCDCLAECAVCHECIQKPLGRSISTISDGPIDNKAGAVQAL